GSTSFRAMPRSSSPCRRTDRGNAAHLQWRSQTLSPPQAIRLECGPVTTAPNTPLLDKVRVPADLKTLPESDLPQLASELRAELIDAVSQTGGHLGAGLGVVELTLAMHYVFDTPNDRIVFDVGHQAYP